MTKVSLLLILILLLSCVGITYAQTRYSYEARIPLYNADTNLGDVEVQITDDQLDWINRDSLISVLNGLLKDDTIMAMAKLSDRLSPAVLPIPVIFNAGELKLETNIDIGLMSRKSTDLGVDLEDEKEQALHPAPFGGAINYRLEQNWGHERLGGDFFSGQFNSFMNIQSLVLENQMYYQSNIEQKWYRGDTRLVKDFSASNIRAQVGDVYPQIQGFMVARPLGGVNIARNFSLNPYRLPYPTGNQNFTLPQDHL